MELPFSRCIRHLEDILTFGMVEVEFQELKAGLLQKIVGLWILKNLRPLALVANYLLLLLQLHLNVNKYGCLMDAVSYHDILMNLLSYELSHDVSPLTRGK